MLKLLKYLLFGVAAVPLSIVTHELGHFVVYHLFGAGDVRLHAASVSAVKDSLSPAEIAVANITGPLITYLTLALAYFLTRREYLPFWIILALAAPLGRIVNFVYIYFRVAGYRPQPNFDEFNFSRNLGFDALGLAVPTALAVIAAFFVFGSRAWREGRFGELARIALALMAGVAVWFTAGPRLLP